MKEGLIKDAYELIIKEIQLFLSLCYVFMIAVGMVFNHCKYSEFGINIFQYADIFDFLIAPFEDFRIILFTLTSIIATFGLVAFDRFWKRKFPKNYSWLNFGIDKKAWFNTYRWITFTLCFLVYTYIMAIRYGQDLKNEINEQAKVKISFVDNTEAEGFMIGKTKEVLFVLVNEKVKIIPLASLVKEMEILPKANIAKDPLPEVSQ